MKRKLLLIFLILALALVACADNEPEEPEAPAVEEQATEIPTEAPAEAEPTEAPTEPAPEPTDEPTAEPTEEPTVEPTAEQPAAPRLGLLRYRDSEEARSGSYQLLMEGVSAAPEGSHYELWLVDDSFNTLNLGEFPVNGAVDYSGSTAQDLIARYNRGFISIEPDGVDDGEIGPVAFNGVIPAESLLHIRHVLTAFQANPDGKAFLIGAEEQLLLAIEHAGFLQEELAIEDLGEAQRHAEHVVNILDGENGERFGDLDGDGVPQNPGDGFGLRNYLEGAKQHAQLAADAEGATDEVKLHAGHVIISSDNALARMNAAIDEALRVIASDSASEAQSAADALSQVLDLAYNGQDVDGNGAIAPIEDEGGWVTAYEHALNMGSLEFFEANPDTAARQDEGSAAPAADPPTEDEDQEEATAEPDPPAAPSEVTIDMVNFAYEPGDISVPAGSTVTWVNKDNGPRHSATASDGSFDTGLLDAGEEAAIVLDTPGTYIYYCTLHGSPDGSGMAATITVTE